MLEKQNKLAGLTERIKPNWMESLTPEQLARYKAGEVSLGELAGISGPEMLEIAMQGFRMYEQGRYKEAKIIFEGLCDLDPSEAYYRTALGTVYLAEEQLEYAKNNFDLALVLNPKSLAGLVNRGEVHLRLGDIVEAAQDFTKAVELDPENKDPLTMRARLLAAAALETIEAAQKEASAGPAKK
ncbi:tetratricopeptide repeat protein [Archangium sp.]|uniref:tetratricopeptide repeat protein n=1 Tax=Archangium sp. TaxID=1872627 RepID=UPI002D4F4B05|nr:tetratricopeptide repeat protein [Archangium sp.]HYO59267.1 tetratricopeptide repeat protein [Archangium sp.]